MVELVDTQDLKSCDLKSRAGSIPALSTLPEFKFSKDLAPVFLCLYFLLMEYIRSIRQKTTVQQATTMQPLYPLWVAFISLLASDIKRYL